MYLVYLQWDQVKGAAAHTSAGMELNFFFGQVEEMV